MLHVSIHIQSMVAGPPGHTAHVLPLVVMVHDKEIDIVLILTLIAVAGIALDMEEALNPV